MSGNKRKPEKYLYLTPDEANTFICAAYNIRYKIGLLFDITFNGGLRISETLAIRPCDINFNTNKISIKTLKQKRDVGMIEILFPSDTIIMCKKIIEHYNIGNDKYVFSYTRQWAWKLFKQVLRKCNFSELYSPHALRHAHGIAVCEATGGNIIKIAKRLRQASPKNAWRYVHLTDMDQKEVVDFLEKIKK